MAKVLRRLGIALGFAFAAVGALWGAFGYSSVCTTCGLRRGTTEWHVPLTPLIVWQSTRDTPTTLSSTVATLGLAPAGHAHQWAFAHGGGNGTTCAIGPGRHLLYATNSAGVSATLAAIARFDGADAAVGWLARLLDSERSSAVAMALTFTPLPAGGLADRAAFDRWWAAGAAARALLLEP